jgi:hypothetical protein
MSDLHQPPSRRSFWLSVVGVIGCFLVFAVVLYVAGIPGQVVDMTRPAAMSDEERLEKGLLTPEERKHRLTELRAKEDYTLISHQWVDKDKGIVRLPVDRAIELTVREAQAKK